MPTGSIPVTGTQYVEQRATLNPFAVRARHGCRGEGKPAGTGHREERRNRPVTSETRQRETGGADTTRQGGIPGT